MYICTYVYMYMHIHDFPTHPNICTYACVYVYIYMHFFYTSTYTIEQHPSPTYGMIPPFPTACIRWWTAT